MLDRVINLIGEDKVNKIKKTNICVFGLGGVGGYVVEALVRSGVSNITIIDNDVVKESNINRQIIATTKTVGSLKTEEWYKRILEINPKCNVKYESMFFNKDVLFDVSGFDYVIDCIDTVTAKIELIERCKKENVFIISSMGTGNKLDPSKLEITDISKTSVCPLARVMRYELKKRGIKNVMVLFSKEEPIKPLSQIKEESRNVPSSMIFVPASAGLMIASYIIRKIIGENNE